MSQNESKRRSPSSAVRTASSQSPAVTAQQKTCPSLSPWSPRHSLEGKDCRKHRKTGNPRRSSGLGRKPSSPAANDARNANRQLRYASKRGDAYSNRNKSGRLNLEPPDMTPVSLPRADYEEPSAWREQRPRNDRRATMHSGQSSRWSIFFFS